jgi:hypothetical protein
LLQSFPEQRNEIKAGKIVEMSENMKLFLRIEYDIGSHVHVEQLNWITTDFELKFKNHSGFCNGPQPTGASLNQAGS